MSAPRMGWAKGATLEVQEFLRLAGQAASSLVSRPIHTRDIVEQLDVIGIGSLTVVLLTGTFTGMVLALQAGVTLDQFDSFTQKAFDVLASSRLVEARTNDNKRQLTGAV